MPPLAGLLKVISDHGIYVPMAPPFISPGCYCLSPLFITPVSYWEIGSFVRWHLIKCRFSINFIDKHIHEFIILNKWICFISILQFYCLLNCKDVRDPQQCLQCIANWLCRLPSRQLWTRWRPKCQIGVIRGVVLSSVHLPHDRTPNYKGSRVLSPFLIVYTPPGVTSSACYWELIVTWA